MFNINSIAAYAAYKELVNSMEIPYEAEEEYEICRVYRKMASKMAKAEPEAYAIVKNTAKAAIDDALKNIEKWAPDFKPNKIRLYPLPQKDTVAVRLFGDTHNIWIATRRCVTAEDMYFVVGVFPAAEDNADFRTIVQTFIAKGRMNLAKEINEARNPEAQYRHGQALFEAVEPSNADYEIEGNPYGGQGQRTPRAQDPRKAAVRAWFDSLEEGGTVVDLTPGQAQVLDVMYCPVGTYKTDRNRSKLCVLVSNGGNNVAVNIRDEFHELVGYVTESRVAKLRAKTPYLLYAISGRKFSKQSLRRWLVDAGVLK